MVQCLGKRLKSERSASKVKIFLGTLSKLANKMKKTKLAEKVK